MNVSFYFDPSCPYCWITSRWLLLVSNQREINIDWQPFSLGLKNKENLDKESINKSRHGPAHRVLRVMLAAQKQHGANLIDLYTAFGIQKHIALRKYDDELIAEVLNEANLPANLIEAADEQSYDEALTKYIQSATDVAGDDIGVPTIIFEAQGGSRNGFFGPVLQELPSNEESLVLWDGLSKLATNSSFYELKRSRPKGGPNTGSTARC